MRASMFRNYINTAMAVICLLPVMTCGIFAQSGANIGDWGETFPDGKEMVIPPPQAATPPVTPVPLPATLPTAPQPTSASDQQPAAPTAPAPVVEQTQEPPRIAVYVIGDVADNVKNALGAKILSAFIGGGRFNRNIERSEAFLAEIAEARKTGSVDKTQVVEAGKKTGIDFVCAASVVSVFDEYSISSRIVNVETADVVFLGELSSPLKSMADLDDVSSKIVASELNKSGADVPGRPNDAPPQPAMPPIAPPPPAQITPPVGATAPGRPNDAAISVPPPHVAEEPKVDMTGSIAKIVGDLVSQSVGKKFGQTVGDAVSEIVVTQVRNELARRGNISADDNIGQIVGKIVADAVSQQVAAKVPGPAGKMGGGQVGKAVGKSVEQAVNELLGGGKMFGVGGGKKLDYRNPPSISELAGNTYYSGGSDERSVGTRVCLRVAWNMSWAEVNVYERYGGYISHDDWSAGHGYEIGLVINTSISPRWSFNYGVDLINRRPVNDESYEVTETALAFPVMLRSSGLSSFSTYFEFGPRFDFPLRVETSESYHKIDRNRFDFGIAFGYGLNFGRNVSIGHRFISGTCGFTGEQKGRQMFQHNVDLTVMFGKIIYTRRNEQ